MGRLPIPANSADHHRSAVLVKIPMHFTGLSDWQIILIASLSAGAVVIIAVLLLMWKYCNKKYVQFFGRKGLQLLLFGRQKIKS